MRTFSGSHLLSYLVHPHALLYTKHMFGTSVAPIHIFISLGDPLKEKSEDSVLRLLLPIHIYTYSVDKAWFTL